VKRGSQDFLHAQDLVVALKLVGLRDVPWAYGSLAAAIAMSPSQVHTSVRRLERCDLFNASRKETSNRNLLELLAHGVRFVFPGVVGPLGRGVATASSASPLDRLLPSGGERFVWASKVGENVGHTVDPLVARVPEMVVADPGLHELLALVDAVRIGKARIGKARERAVAVTQLELRLLADGA